MTVKNVPPDPRTNLKVLYVYGTLRPGGGDLHKVPGRMADLGFYPGIKLLSPEAGEFVTTERVVVSKARLEDLDRYEGFRPSDPGSSLFVRKPYLDGEIYEYNHDISQYPQVESGDWLKHISTERGTAASKVEEPEGVAGVDPFCNEEEGA